MSCGTARLAFHASCFPEVRVNLTPTTDNPSATSPVSARTLAHDKKLHLNELAGIVNAPLISVCMPVYNAKRYIGEAIESILAQTFRDFEFLIIDDGSTDRSLAILERYAAQDTRIRLSSRPNAGYVVRLNEMLHQARGDLIARMDADDVALPERFARQVEFLHSHPEVDVVGGAQEQISSKGHYLSIHYDPQGHEEIEERGLTGVCAINHPSVMMRRKAVLAVGGYQVELMPAEDLDLWLRMGERGRLANLPDVITRYRLHDSSVSAIAATPAAQPMAGGCRRGLRPSRHSSAEAEHRAVAASRPHVEASVRDVLRVGGISPGRSARGDTLRPSRCKPGALVVGELAVAGVRYSENEVGQGRGMSPLTSVKRPPCARNRTSRESEMSAVSSAGLKHTVSVVIPLYNTEKYVAECIGSALDQTLRDLEVLVIDDGSRDRSVEIVEEIARRDSRVRLLRHPGGVNLGVSRTRRLGIVEASGEYIAFLDADDAFEPSKLERQVSLMKAHPGCLLCHTGVNVMAISFEDKEFSRLLEPQAKFFSDLWNLFRPEITEYSFLDRDDALRSNLICNSSTLTVAAAVRSAVVATRQVFQAEDFVQWILLAAKGPFVYTPERLTRYRVHSASSSYLISHEYLRYFYSQIETLLTLHVLTDDPELRANAESELFCTLAHIRNIYAENVVSEITDSSPQSRLPPGRFEGSSSGHSALELQSQVNHLQAQVRNMSAQLATIRSSRVYRGLVRVRNLLNGIKPRVIKR